MNLITKVFWVVVVLIIPLLRTTQLNEAFEQPKVLLFICVTFMYLGLLGVSVSRPSYNVNKGIVVYLLLILLGWLAVTSVLGVNLQNSIFGQYYRYQGLATQIALMAFSIGFRQIKKEDDYVGKMAIASGLINAGYIFKQAIYDGSVRPTANFGNPNFAGGWLDFMAVLGIGQLKLTWAKISYLLVMTGAIAVTGSRSALIALGVMLAVIYWPEIREKRRRLALMIFGVIMMLSIYGIVANNRPVSQFDRREVIWQRAIEAISKRPILGWGLENFEIAFNSTLRPDDFDWKNVRVDKAHNEILEVAVASGLMGLCLYLGLNVVVGYKLKEDRKMLAVWLGYLVISCLTVVNITSQMMFYWAVGVAAKRWR
jgi:O-antigen ligase